MTVDVIIKNTFVLYFDHKAIVNEDTSGNVLQLQAEIKKLKAALENARGQCIYVIIIYIF